MREIIFRGKRPITEEWVYGTGLLYDSINTWLVDNPSHKAIAFGEEHYQVIPETVGQYTGLTDKNGKKIFEGDVFAWNDNEINEITGKPYPDEISVVCFDDKKSAFVSKTLNGACESLYETISDKNSRYIGNIHDNPELLKGGG